MAPSRNFPSSQPIDWIGVVESQTLGVLLSGGKSHRVDVVVSKYAFRIQLWKHWLVSKEMTSLIPDSLAYEEDSLDCLVFASVGGMETD